MWLSFGTTQWSVILTAADTDAEDRDKALSSLCESYWQPLYEFVRRSGSDHHDAEDLTQAFLAKLIEGEYLQGVSPEKGRFRTFLRTSIKRFMISAWEAQRAQKRGGTAPHFSLDFESAEHRYRAEPSDTLTPEQAYDRRWALTVLDRAMSELEQEQKNAGKGQRFHLLKTYLAGDGQTPPYSETAAHLDMREGAARIAVHRLRQRYATLIRSIVSSTLDTPASIDDEIGLLFSALRV